jgi:hypothetical protein
MLIHQFFVGIPMLTSKVSTTSNLIKSLVVTASIAGGFSGALASSAQAASFSPTGWTATGDVRLTPTPISLSTNALAGDDSPALDSTFNFSGNPAVSAFDSTLQNFLGILPEALDLAPFEQATEGSAIKQTFDAQAGDKLQFTWKFLTNENNSSNDYAFLLVNGQRIDLANALSATTPSSPFFRESNGTYSYTFGATGAYTIGLGVVDIGDVAVTSALQLSNFQYTAIPTPAMLPGLVGLGLGLLRKRKLDKSDTAA